MDSVRLAILFRDPPVLARRDSMAKVFLFQDIPYSHSLRNRRAASPNER
jgi:hypothetical protein